jgi:hypothetical protein
MLGHWYGLEKYRGREDDPSALRDFLACVFAFDDRCADAWMIGEFDEAEACRFCKFLKGPREVPPESSPVMGWPDSYAKSSPA